jgi:large repetitive protein
VEVEQTSRRIESRGRKAAVFALFAFALLTALTFASSARSEIAAPPPPQVWSDKADYAPGETVTLSGANWAPGESVHIRVNDDAGQTWSRDVDVVADENGAISDQFNLPTSFVAVYSVTATGAQSGTATWSFTDSNMRARLQPGTVTAPQTFTWEVRSNTTCGGSLVSSGSTSVDTNFTTIAQVTLTQSLRITAPSISGWSFVNWTKGSTTVTANPGCLTADSNNANQNDNWSANYMQVADTTPPVIAPTVTGTLGSNGWYTSDVSVSWTVTDPDSTVASTSGCGTSNVTSDTAGVAFTCTATSAGGTASNSVTIKRDATAPVIALRAAGDDCSVPGDNGWCRGTQTAGFRATDATSGFAPDGDLAVDFTQSTATNGSAVNISSGTKTDRAGNTATAINAGPYKIDSVVPTYNCTPSVDSDWHGSNQSFACTASDAGSGVASPAGGNFTLSTSVADGNDNDDASTNSQGMTDVAGNSATAQLHHIKVDRKKPTSSTSQDPSANGAGWNKTSVTVTLTADDGSGSGVDEIVYSVDGGLPVHEAGSSVDVALMSEGVHAIDFHAVDNVGNSEANNLKTVKIDKTAPTISDLGPTMSPNAAGWYKTDVVNQFKASDALSGLDSACQTAFPDPVTGGRRQNKTTTGEGLAIKVSSSSCTDVAGNPAAAIDSAAFKIDQTVPTNVSVTGFSDGAVFYTGGSLPTAGCSSPSDALSGVASSSGPTKIADSRNANGVGSVTYRCSATDNADNSATDTKTFVVRYGGNPVILQPISPDNTSLFSRGKAVPVKFRLAGDEPNGFSVSGWSLLQVSVSCTAFDSVDGELEPIVENPSNGFRYDATADQYVYNANFKDKAVGTCWKVKVTLNDSPATVFYSAVFKLQK